MSLLTVAPELTALLIGMGPLLGCVLAVVIRPVKPDTEIDEVPF